MSYKQISLQAPQTISITRASDDLDIFHLPVHPFHGAPGFLLPGVRKESETSRSLRYSIHHETNWSSKHGAKLNNSEFKTQTFAHLGLCHLP